MTTVTMTTTDATASPGQRRRIVDAIFAPVDAASLAIFRIGFGAIVLYEVIRYFTRGWIQQYFVTPSFHLRTTVSAGSRPGPATGCSCTSRCSARWQRRSRPAGVPHHGAAPRPWTDVRIPPR